MSRSTAYGQKRFRRTAIDLSREDFDNGVGVAIVASKSEPYLPSTVSGGSDEQSPPFTAIPEAFYKRRTGMAWLSSSKSGLSAASSRGRSLQEASFEVEHVSDIKAVDSGWLDDDVEEVMVVSKKDKKMSGRPLSSIVEALDGLAYQTPKHTPPQLTVSVDADHFEYIEGLRSEAVSEAVVARKIDDGNVFTVKLVRKSGPDVARQQARLRKEQQVLRMLTAVHNIPYVTKLWWSFEDAKAMYLVMDRTDGPNLRTVIENGRPLSSHQAFLCAAELAAGLCELHKRGVVHANIRPECILVGHHGHIVISDYGKAKFSHSRDRDETSLAASHTAVPEEAKYQAPEQVLGWEYDSVVDWWSFGLVIYWMLTGMHPLISEFDTAHTSIVHSKILHARMPELNVGLEESACQLVAKCLQRNPALRLDGFGAKMHAYFKEIDWDDVAAQRIQAPFRSLHKSASAVAVDSNQNQSCALPQSDTRGHIYEQPEPFSFDWQHDILPSQPSHQSGLSRIRYNLQHMGSSQEHSGDKTIVVPTPVYDTGDITRLSSGSSLPVVSDVRLPSDLHDADASILPDVVPTPHAGLPTPPNSRIGNLRKYSSLNFDDLDSLDSLELTPGPESFRRLARSQSSLLLRKSKSILGLSQDSSPKDADDTFSSTPARLASKLRKRSRAEILVPPASSSPAPPVPQLPKGLEHIGSGIGYTYRGEARRPALQLASLTPRTCHGIFTGRRIKSGTKRKVKDGAGDEKDTSGGEGQGQTDDAAAFGAENENEEDLMDEVMREIYGDEWNRGISPQMGGTRSVPTAGLGWGDMLSMTRFGMAEDASFAGPDCTLRLVTSPSTPRLDR